MSRLFALLGLAACTPASLDSGFISDEMSEDEAELLGRSGGSSRDRDTSPPTGAIQLTGGGLWSSAIDAQFDLTWTDDDQVEAFCASTLLSCSDWRAIRPNTRVRLANHAAEQTVRVWYRDRAGNVSSPATTRVRLDTSGPRAGSLLVTPGMGTVSLSWSGFSDATSGIAAYRLVGRAGAVVPSCDRDLAQLYQGTDTSISLSGFGPEQWAFRVCAIDAAGNVGVGASARATILGESDPPIVANFQLAGGARASQTRSVTVSADLTDASGVRQVCLSESATSAGACTYWRPWYTGLQHELSGGEGGKELHAFFKDANGNVSAMASDGIVFDRTGPADGVLSALAEPAAFTVSWAGYDDELSEITGYILTYAPERAPDSCSEGTRIELGVVTSHTVSGLAGSRYGVRVCAVDSAGNQGNGESINIRLPDEHVPPVIEAFTAESECTTDRDVQLHVDASDESEILRMCIGEGTTCPYWEPWDPDPIVRVSSGDGVKPIVVKVRDEFGNESALASLEVEYRSGGDADGDGYDVCSDCDDSDPGVNPGEVERLTPGDENCDGEADEAAVIFVVAWQCLSHGTSYAEARARTDAETESLREYLTDMDLGLDRIDESASGLDPSINLADYDLVLYTKCGWGWQAYNQTTVNGMLAAQARGANTMMFEDDASWRAENVSNETDIILVGAAVSNGRAGTIRMDTTSNHFAYRGPYGTPTDTAFNWDMDQAVELGFGETVLARHSYYGTPVWLAYEDPTDGHRAISMLFNFATANHGTVSDAAGLENLEIIFKNSFAWSLGLDE